MIKKLQFAFLVIVPLVFLVIGMQFDRTKYSTDPESAYLLNGLNIARGKSVGHFDNPGTTVQIYSAIVLRGTHLFRSTDDDIQTDVLKNSELYIEVLRKGFISLNALILLLLGVAAFLLLGNIWVGLILQVAPFLSVILIEECFTKVAPEPLLFATTAALMMLLLKYYKSEKRNDLKYTLLFGLLGGFGVATKMTFLPILILPFIVLQGRKRKLTYTLAIIPSFVLFTLPAVPGYLHMAKWFLNLGTHTGTYGQGNSGIIDTSQYLNSLVSIAQNNIALIAGMIFSLFAILLFSFIFRKQNRPASKTVFNILLGVILAQAGSILMVAKHYHSNHYLFPALSLIGFTIVFAFLLVNVHLPEKKQKIFSFFLPVLLAIVIGGSLFNKQNIYLAYEGYRLSNQSTDETNIRLERDYKGFVKVYYYPSSFNVYSSLRWGNVYSRQNYTDMLTALYPEGLFYNVWEKSFQLWETSIPVKEFVKKYGGRILLVGGPRTPEDIAIVEQGGLKLNKLFESRVQAVFEIDTAASVLFRNSHLNMPATWSLRNDFETISADKQWIMSINGTKFCKSTGLETNKSRSGKYAISLPGIECYGMDYDISDVKPGDSFEVSIWRFGNSKDAFLVASAGKDDPYYIQSDGFLEKDDKGWEQVILDVKIPLDFKAKKLKIYLWNHANIPVWFDDFQISKY